MTDTTDAAYVTFTGDSGAVLATVPELGDTQTFTIVGKAITDKDQARKDGEVRRTFTFQLLDVVPGDITKAERDPQLPFDEAEEIG